MIAIFVGPSLPKEQVAELTRETHSVVLGPAAQGDLYRVCRRRPRAIGLIDGYFAQVPAVWHKEILWALSEGIPVVGGASMGALRAAELDAFGMLGVGEIYEAFARGEYVRDDEVALAHADATLNYRALSEPLVNIRATLREAERVGIISAEFRHFAEETAAAEFYPDRSLKRLCHLLASAGWDTSRFAAWWPSGRVDQKAIDARRVIEATLRAAISTAREVGFFFEHTAMWEELVRGHGASNATPHPNADEQIIEELKRHPNEWRNLRVAALGRMFAADAARTHGKTVEGDELHLVLNRLRERHQLETSEQLEQWMAANALTDRDLAELLASEIRVDWIADQVQGELDRHILDQLKVSGAYPEGGAILREQAAKVDEDANPARFVDRADDQFSRPDRLHEV